MWRKILIIISIFFIGLKVDAQNLIYTFIDPCTKATTLFTVPLQGNTTIFFLGKQQTFTAADVSSGAFATWINQTYSDYRKVTPCSVQSTTVVRNQITSQIIGNTVQSVVGSIMGQAQSAASGSVVSSGVSAGGNDAASKGNTPSGSKQKKNENNNSNNSNSTVSSGSNGSTGNTGTNQQGNTSNGGGSQGSTTGTSNGSASNGGTVSGSNGGNNSNGTSQSGGNSNTNTSQSKGNSDQKGEEVAGTTTMNVDARQDKGSSESSSSGGGGGSKKSSSSAARNNPVIVSSDLTSAQNLDKSFTGIINVGMSQSSLTGTASWGVTSMIWFNFKQFALSGRYSKIQFSKNGKLKLIHNFNLTGVYSYGNYLGFLGYSAILNAGKWGITGGNISAAATKTPDDGNIFISPSVTAFYTKPFQFNKKLIVSPEIYIISTPLVYSSVDKVTVTDRTFSAFIGTGFDYQLSKRFKFNLNYKLNMSTNPDFPILSFFLIGSKVNL